MIYDYLSNFNLSDFRYFNIVVKLYDEYTDSFDDLDLLISIFTLDSSLIYNFKDLFNVFVYSSISHVIEDFGKTLKLEVVVYDSGLFYFR